MHLVNDNVTIWPRDRELLQSIFDIGDFLGLFQRFLDQFVVVGRPVGVNGKARQYLMVDRWPLSRGEMVEYRLGEARLAASSLIAVILCHRHQIMFFFRIEAEILNELFEQTRP